MERKEDTPVRKTRRKYEEKNKEKRKQASGNFGTMAKRQENDYNYRLEYHPIGDKTFVMVAREQLGATDTPLDIMKRLITRQSARIQSGES